MTTVVLLVLAIVWGVLLVSWLRTRSGGVLSDSVGTFRRHLSVLERATPARVAPANRLHGRGAGHAIPAYRSASMPPRVGGQPGPARSGYYPSGQVDRYGDLAVLRRRQAQRRRRDVLIAILAGAAGSFILAAVLGVSMMWPVQVLFDVMLVAYIALLVRMRNLALEREAKLTYLRERGRVARARIPSSRDAYEFGTPGYDLDFRRAAN